MSAPNAGTGWDAFCKASLDVLFPHTCAFCRQVCNPAPGFPGICRQCLALLPIRSGKSAKPLQIDPLLSSEIPGTDIYCLAYYQGVLRQALLRFKFGDAPDLAAALAALLVQQIRQTGLHPAAVAAVPLHKSRLRERGYNQAQLLAGQIAQQLELPDWSGFLCRSRATCRQSEQVSREERVTNLRHAFSLAPGSPIRPREEFANRPAKPVLLVDDVLTTGVTMIEAARPFWAAGQPVAGLVIASNHR